MKKATSILLFIFLCLYSFAQVNPYGEIKIKCSFFTTDQLGNLYVVSDNQLIKYNQQAEEQYTFSSNQYGDISSVDASNPYKILVFYQDFSIILFLDNMLSLTGDPINLQHLFLEQSTLTCFSHNNGLWTYDPLQKQLTRLDEQLDITVQTGNLEQQLNMSIEPDYMTEYNNKLYLTNPEKGILVFDIYGTYLNSIPVKGLDHFQVNQTGIVYSTNNAIHKYHFKTLATTKLKKDLGTFKKARLVKEQLYLQKENSVQLFKLK